eukprot:TRINITY_DN12368_c0_g1_i1.p2 TRINITY_DN12368_c0_g1~~TRINITY_DN12368_c0_g1_i1.p2  ORF type:complete len:113 (-),score=16.08 TRINITY_DN12368_c0_g1_i1:41-379(-)
MKRKGASNPFYGVWEVWFNEGAFQDTRGTGTWTINSSQIIYADPNFSTSTITDRWESADMLSFRLECTPANDCRAIGLSFDITLKALGNGTLQGKQTRDGSNFDKFTMKKKR